MKFPVIIICILLISYCMKAMGQEDTTTRVDNKKLHIILGGTAVAYGTGLVILSNTWYDELGKTGFHFYNDNTQWNQVDKLGHSYTAYHLSRIGHHGLKLAGVSDKKSAIWGSVMSQALMIPIEMLDGYSKDFGFSWGDIAADLFGAGFYLGQELLWEKQKIKFKFSFHSTEYSSYHPEVLGGSLSESWLKDYNGQTYWLSFDVYSLLHSNNHFPKWLNIALGYGAEGMVYGRDQENVDHGYQSYRQFYLGIDIDLSHIKSRKKYINTLLFFADMIKLPAPAVEFNCKSGVKYHWIYF